MEQATVTKKLRGFAAMTPERRRELASLGGKNVPSAKRAFARDPKLAASAGTKGGNASWEARKNFQPQPNLTNILG